MTDDFTLDPARTYNPKKPVVAQPAVKTEPPLDLAAIDVMDLSTDDSLALIGKLTPVAAASLEYVLRNPSKFPTQAVAAAKIVLERKLGAVPDTVIQNNMQFIVKWQD